MPKTLHTRLRGVCEIFGTIGVNLVSKVCAYDTLVAPLGLMSVLIYVLYTCRLSETFINHISAPAVRKVYRKCRPQETKHQRCERCV